MNFLELATELIDLRSFSNLWYWIALAALWSTASHWVVGVPFDLVTRARRGNEQAAHDMRILAEAHVNRILRMAEISGLWFTGSTAFMLTLLAILGWVYDVEFAQAVMMLFAPMVVVGIINIDTARRLRESEFEDLIRQLSNHRIKVQMVGVLAIFATAFWGMWVNVNFGALGG